MPKICKYETCNNPVFSGGYCYNHRFLNEKKQKRIKQFSTKREIVNKEYIKNRTVYLQANPLCGARLLDCTLVATDVHHKKGRGVFFLEQNTWLPVCRSCHQWIEIHPKEAKELGFSSSRLNE